ncbi:MAG TPA: NAD(P)/FAD-dependent oxidoreductase [Methylovirgula sp.]
MTSSAASGSDYDVIIIGAGAAGIGAGRRLAAAAMRFRILEARGRIGGRAFTVTRDYPLDLGCGWLHSADINPLTSLIEDIGFTIDRTLPAWGRASLDVGMSKEEQAEFRDAISAFHDKIETEALKESDKPAAAFLEADNRFNPLIGAVTSYISGVEPDRLSSHDVARYAGSGVNWRVVEGYGAGIAALARDLPITLDCPVRLLDHSRSVLRIETGDGTITARQAIVTLPTNLLAMETLKFVPALPEKIAAASVLPLGLADKVVLGLDDAFDLPKDGHLFGRADTTATASYHLRPFGRHLIEAYFAGHLAADLEKEGDEAFFAFAEEQLVTLLGSALRKHLRRVSATAWGGDPFSRGSYSYALPGHAEARRTLAEPVDDRIFFAGEACSVDLYSTAHGAYLTGIAAADAAIAAQSLAARAQRPFASGIESPT